MECTPQSRGTVPITSIRSHVWQMLGLHLARAAAAVMIRLLVENNHSSLISCSSPKYNCFKEESDVVGPRIQDREGSKGSTLETRRWSTFSFACISDGFGCIRNRVVKWGKLCQSMHNKQLSLTLERLSNFTESKKGAIGWLPSGAKGWSLTKMHQFPVRSWKNPTFAYLCMTTPPVSPFTWWIMVPLNQSPIYTLSRPWQINESQSEVVESIHHYRVFKLKRNWKDSGVKAYLQTMVRCTGPKINVGRTW